MKRTILTILVILLATTALLNPAVTYASATDNYTPWKTLSELHRWLRDDDTSDAEWIYKRHDCDDFALPLSEKAFRDGRFIGVLEIKTSHWWHYMNWTYVDGKPYKIEPQTNQVFEWVVD